MSRIHEVNMKLRPAMLALRDAEDWARLDLRDEVLAERIRGVHESLTNDVLNGVSFRDSDRRKAKLWDRYCVWRRKSPDAISSLHVRYLRRLSRRRVAA